MRKRFCEGCDQIQRLYNPRQTAGSEQAISLHYLTSPCHLSEPTLSFAQGHGSRSGSVPAHVGLRDCRLTISTPHRRAGHSPLHPRPLIFPQIP